MKFYNSLGQEVSTLLEKEVAAGEHRFVYDAGDLPSGAYFYTLQASGNNGETYSASKKMILLK